MSHGQRLWPRLADLRLSYELFTDYEVDALDPPAYKALLSLVSQCAASIVWTYSPPSDGSLVDDDQRMARICRITLKEWRRIRPLVEPFFNVSMGKWHLKKEWIGVDDRPVRFAIPRSVKQVVLAREGKACTYCGDTAGPFDFDHILPVVRGGTNDPSNLTIACATCNRSKGGKTLAEWMASR